MTSESRKVAGTNLRRVASLAVVAGLTVSVTAACGSSSKKAATPKASSSVAAPASANPLKATAAPAPKVNRVVVSESDAKLSLSSTSFHAGNYTFSAKNTGKAKHALAIYGPGLTNKPTGATITPGQSTDLIVPLKKGSYTLWSPVADDKAKGLEVHITVS
jgi:hypothetical protein